MFSRRGSVGRHRSPASHSLNDFNPLQKDPYNSLTISARLRKGNDVDYVACFCKQVPLRTRSSCYPASVRIKHGISVCLLAGTAANTKQLPPCHKLPEDLCHLLCSTAEHTEQLYHTLRIMHCCVRVRGCWQVQLRTQGTATQLLQNRPVCEISQITTPQG